MTDAALVRKKLAFIETCVHELRTLVDASQLASDLRDARFAERTLQLAIQAIIDVASHVVSDERLGEPRTDRELFDLLARGWGLPADLALTLHRMSGFRNILVHGYTDVDLAVVRDVIEHRLDDLLAFVQFVRARAA